MTSSQLIDIAIYNTNQIAFNWWLQDFVSDNGFLDAGTWVHLCFTYKAGIKIKNIYRNGVIIKSGSILNEVSTTNDIRIGADINSRFFSGLLDDFRIYDFELSPNQVQELYKGRVDIYSSIKLSSNIGIGTSLIDNDIITIAGNLNVNDFKIKNNSSSNFLITSNDLSNSSNNIINVFNSRYSTFNSYNWINSNSSIYLSSNGNIGVGSTNPKEKLDIFGNLNINGKILPNSCNSFDIGSSNHKFKELYLSGNSIYLDNTTIKNSNNYLSSSNININQITIRNNTNGINKTISLNSNGDFMINNKFLLGIDNRLQLSNIVFSNVFSNSFNNISNLNNSKFNSINSTDLIPIGSCNRFITNDIYNRPATFTGTIQSYNLITSNLNITGDTTTFNTTIYQTEQLFIENTCNYPAMILKQININKNVAEFYTSNLITTNVSISGTGNTINTASDNSNYKYAYFANNGTFTINSDMSCDILIVGGGGGGFDNNGPGGGAGQVLYYTDRNTTWKSGNSITLSAGSYNISIGSGGSRMIHSSQTSGQNGGTTSINLGATTILSAVGGAGCTTLRTSIGGNVGGCCGGATPSGQSRPTSINGGGQGGLGSGGGGGGANISGTLKNGGDENDATRDRHGGAGVDINITGTSIGVGGGGAGSRWDGGTYSATHGGGIGYGFGNGTDGTPNTGGGGSGGGYNNSLGAGGSGVVIIRYSLKNLTNQIRFVVNSNGNIGIGTINPISKLNVIGNINSTGLIVNNNNIINQIKTNDSNYSNSIINSWNYSNNLYLSSSNSFLNISNSKQDLFNPSTILLGIGSNISNLNYSNFINRPDLSIYSSSVNSTSNLLYSNLSNIELNSSNTNISYINTNINNLVKFQWITNGNNVYTNSNVGIGSTIPTMNLDINGNLNTNELLIKKGNISNFFITSNIFENRSNNYYSSFSNRDLLSSNSNISYINNIVNTNLITLLNNTDVWKIGNNFTLNIDYITSITNNFNSLELTNNSIATYNYTNQSNINKSSYDFNFYNGAISTNERPFIKPWGAYFADDWSGTTLLDSSGNGRHATTSGTITKTTASGNGAYGAITYISGGITSVINWPSGSIPTNFTILGLMRYTNASTNQGRILTSSSTNFLLGYNTTNEGTGIAHFNGWKTPTNLSVLTNKTDWLCMIGKNGGTTPNNIIANGIGRGNATGGDGGNSFILGINNDSYGSVTKSDWALSAVIIYNTQLTDDNMFKLNSFIDNYEITGNLSLLKSNIFSITDNYYPILKDVSGNIINPNAWYKFDDTTNLGIDSSGNGFNLTNYNSVGYNTNFNVYGTGSSSFNSANSRYLLGSGVNINGKSFSISFWVYPTSTSDTFIYAKDNSTAIRGALHIGYRNSTNFTFAFYGDDLEVTIANHENKWNFFTCTYNVSNNQQIAYVNGVLTASRTCGGSLNAPNQNYNIGRNFIGGSYFSGYIDDFRIYNELVLTQAQINQLYNRIIDKSYPILKNTSGVNINPIAWYKLDNNFLTTDSSGNNKTLTNNNSISTNTIDFIKGDGCAQFNGTNYFQINEPSYFSPNNSFSISLWMKLTNITNDYKTIFSCRSVSPFAGYVLYIIPSSYDMELWLPSNSAWNPTYLLSNYFGSFTNIWKHLILTFNKRTSDYEIKIYLDGVLINTIINTTYVPNTNNNFRIGAGANEFTTPQFYLNNGSLIDDFRFYNFVLTSNQIQELYNGRVDIYSSNLSSNILINSNVSFLDNAFSFGVGSYNNTLVSTNNSLVLSQNYIAKINYNNDININSGTYKAVFNNGTISFDETSYVRPWGAYFANDWSGTTLLDSSGNGRHATTTGTITKITGSGNGASGLITYIYGGTGATISWPSGSIPANFTILSLSRYTATGIKRRIFTGENGNWLHGHHNGNRGVAFYEGWKTIDNVSVGIIDDWLCCIGKNGGTTSNNILVDGVPKGTAIGGSGNNSLRINSGINVGESSDWALSAVIIYDSHLSDAYMVKLNNFINTYKTTGNLEELKSNILSINDKSYPILKDNSGNNFNPLVWYKFDDNSTNMLLNSSGNNFNLTNNGTTFDNTTYIKGNGSVKFNHSSSQYLSIPSINLYNIQSVNGISFCLWFRMNTTNTGAYPRIFDFSNGNTTTPRWILLSRYTSTDNRLCFDIYNSTNPSGNRLTTNNYIDGNWHHIVWTINNTGNWIIYIDGITASFTATLPTNINIENVNFTSNSLGKSLINGDGYLSGNIDDFRIYNFVLTSTQVQELYNGRVDIYNINNEIINRSLISYTSNLNSLVLTQNSIIKTNYINDTNINTGTYNIDFNNGKIIIGDNSYVKPWGAYFADDWSGTTLLDSSGNGRHATTSGSITKITESGNGASGAITYIRGGITTTINWPSGSIPTNFTILGLQRYTNASGNQGRFLASSFGNWLLGTNLSSDGDGIAFFEGWKTPQTNFLKNKTDWLCIIGKNGGTIPNNILTNGIGRGSAIGGTGGGSYSLCINNDPYGASTKSDWGLSCVIIYDSILSDEYMIRLNNFINIYKSSGNLTELKYNILRIIDNNSYPILKNINNNIINPIVWYKFDDLSYFLNETLYSSNNIINNGITYDNINYIKGNGSIKFIASSLQYGIIPNNFNWNSINALNGISFSWWARNTNLTGNYGRIFDFGNKNSTNDGGCRYIMVSRLGTTNNLRFDITNPPEFNYGYTNSYNFDTSGINYYDGTWRYYVWTISPSGIWNIYINNSKILDNTQKIAIPTMSGTIINYLGRSLYNSDGYYDGNIDDFRIYNFVLTSNQIQELYNGRIEIYNANNSISQSIGLETNSIITTYNSLVLSKNSLAKLNYNNDIYLPIGTYDININGGIGIGESPYVKPWGSYFANDWSGTTLLDSSGNGRHATTSSGNITKTTGSGNGATGAITYISGGTSATISWPTGSIPTNFTILSLTRYTATGTKRRILQGQTTNFLHGHWGQNGTGYRGVAHYEGWKTDLTSVGIIDDWLCFICKNGGAVPNNILADGATRGTISGGTGNDSLRINAGLYAGESSDWALSAVIIYNSHLSDAHMIKLNNFINTYKSSGNIIELKKNILGILDNSYPILFNEKQYPPIDKYYTYNFL
jgi:hypothetical protein